MPPNAGFLKGAYFSTLIVGLGGDRNRSARETHSGTKHSAINYDRLPPCDNSCMPTASLTHQRRAEYTPSSLLRSEGRKPPLSSVLHDAKEISLEHSSWSDQTADAEMDERGKILWDKSPLSARMDWMEHVYSIQGNAPLLVCKWLCVVVVHSSLSFSSSPYRAR
jgi:hypothetical protein